MPLNPPPTINGSHQTFWQSESLDLTPSTDYILFLYSCTFDFQTSTQAYKKFALAQGHIFDISLHYHISIKTSTLNHLSYEDLYLLEASIIFFLLYLIPFCYQGYRMLTFRNRQVNKDMALGILFGSTTSSLASLGFRVLQGGLLRYHGKGWLG